MGRYDLVGIPGIIIVFKKVLTSKFFLLDLFCLCAIDVLFILYVNIFMGGEVVNRYTPVVLVIAIYSLAAIIYTSMVATDVMMTTVLLILLRFLSLNAIINQPKNSIVKSMTAALVITSVLFVVIINWDWIWNKCFLKLYEKIIVKNLDRYIHNGTISNRLKDLFTKEFLLCVIQWAICLVMIIYGVIHKNDRSGQNAYNYINIFGYSITLLEVIKLIYLVLCGLIIGGDKKLFGKNREWLLLVHTIILSILLLGCNELGTLLVIVFTYSILMLLFSKDKKTSRIIAIVIFGGFIGFWIFSVFLYDNVYEGDLSSLSGNLLKDLFQKLISRFGVVFNPLEANINDSLQIICALEGIAMGGLTGVKFTRYRVGIIKGDNDFAFSSIVQNCGALVGLVIIILYIVIFYRIINTALNEIELDSKITITGIAILITVENLIHISYNLGIFPITGITLFFLSNGFTSFVVGQLMIMYYMKKYSDRASKELKSYE